MRYYGIAVLTRIALAAFAFPAALRRRRSPERSTS